MKKKKNILVLIISLILICVTGCNKNIEKNKITIISTSFPGFDAARAITKNNNEISVKMLLKPGVETHHYEPTPQDIINIQNSDIFIYVGGDSDEWVSDILKNIDTSKTKIIKLIDLVNLSVEEKVEGMEEHDDTENKAEDEEYDEHVWTSPINYIEIVKYIKSEISKLDSDNEKIYDENFIEYTNELKKIDEEIKKIVLNSKRKEIIFGDRFPIRYFADEYGLIYYAAFPGCSDATEASAKTIAFLIDKVKTDNIPVVFRIELSSGKIANEIAKETNTKVLEFHSAHNISQKEFDAGITYVDIMKKNIDTLKEALN